MITEINGNLLDASEQVIGHQTNCKGAMGGGIALALKRKYPKMYREYRRLCRTNDCFGKTRIIQIDGSRHIANIFGQKNAGAGLQTDYAALEIAFEDLKAQMKYKNLNSLALPCYIGCGLGGGDRNTVRGIIERCFGDSGINTVLYKI